MYMLPHFENFFEIFGMLQPTTCLVLIAVHVYPKSWDCHFVNKSKTIYFWQNTSSAALCNPKAMMTNRLHTHMVLPRQRGCKCLVLYNMKIHSSRSGTGGFL